MGLFDGIGGDERLLMMGLGMMGGRGYSAGGALRDSFTRGMGGYQTGHAMHLKNEEERREREREERMAKMRQAMGLPGGEAMGPYDPSQGIPQPQVAGTGVYGDNPQQAMYGMARHAEDPLEAAQDVYSTFNGEQNAFSKSPFLFRNASDPTQIIAGQFSSGGGAFYHGPNGEPVPIDQSQWIPTKPFSFNDMGGGIAATDPLRAIMGMPNQYGVPSAFQTMQQPGTSVPTAPTQGTPPRTVPEDIPRYTPGQFPGGEVLVNGQPQRLPPEAFEGVTHTDLQSPQGVPGSRPQPPQATPNNPYASGRKDLPPDKEPEYIARAKVTEMDAVNEEQLRQDEPLRVSQLNSLRVRRNIVAREAFKAFDMTDVWSAGMIGTPLALLPGSKAKNLQAKLDTFKARLAIDGLQNMRKESTTGGALGNVSEGELKILADMVAALDQAQSPEQLREQIQAVMDMYDDFVFRAEQRHAAQYGSVPEFTQAPKTELGGPLPPEEVKRRVQGAQRDQETAEYLEGLGFDLSGGKR